MVKYDAHDLHYGPQPAPLEQTVKKKTGKRPMPRRLPMLFLPLKIQALPPEHRDLLEEMIKQ